MPLDCRCEILHPGRSETGPAHTSVDAPRREAAVQLAKEYDQIPREMPSGDERTRLMERFFSRMKIEAPKVQGLLSTFQQSSSAGERLMAIAVLDMFPDSDHLEWLAERMDPEQEQPFVSYHAAVALLDAVTDLPTVYCAKLRHALAKARELARRLKSDSDRVTVLQRAQQEFQRKCGLHL